MRRFVVLLALATLTTLVAAPASAGSMMTELSNAAKQGSKGGMKAELVTFTLHFGTGAEPIVVTGADYESYELHEQGGVPTHLELFAGSGSEKHNILINIDAARYYRLNIEKVDKDWRYDFHFFF